MLKTKIKYLITFIGILFALILFNTNTVQATTYTSDELNEMINLVPDEITLDITEAEFEKADDLLEKKVREIWESNNISTDIGTNINFSAYYPYDIDRFYTGTVSFSLDGETYSKNVTINYSNSSNKNASDSEYIQSLTINAPTYYELDIEDYNIIETISEYYENLIGDEDVTTQYYISSGSPSSTELNVYNSTGTFLLIFKNDILYDIRCMETRIVNIIPVINNVPSTVSDTDLTDYVVDIITNPSSSDSYWDFGSHITEVVSGTDINITNGYTVYFDSTDYPTSYIIINRETSSVDLTESETNIKLGTDTTVVPSNTVLYVEPITTGSTYETVEKALSNVSQFLAYDITLLSDGVEIQPNGNVKISIPVPEGFDTSNLVVYRIDEDETKTKYDVTVKDGYAVFETDHFSTYVLAELASTTTTTDNNTAETTITTTTTTTDTTTEELDEPPKTGASEISIQISMLVALISIASLVIIRKNNVF